MRETYHRIVDYVENRTGGWKVWGFIVSLLLFGMGAGSGISGLLTDRALMRQESAYTSTITNLRAALAQSEGKNRQLLMTAIDDLDHVQKALASIQSKMGITVEEQATIVKKQAEATKKIEDAAQTLEKITESRP